jgi:hypothetical protein
MTQKNPEIKIIPPRAVSRDFKTRDLESEKPSFVAKEVDEEPHFEDQPTGRREFFKAVLPATGKLLTTFIREVGTTVSSAVEDAKLASKKKSD